MKLGVSGDKEKVPAPLFGGLLYVGTKTVQTGPGSVCSLAVQLRPCLKLNPTRFVRHQQTPTGLRRQARLNPLGWLFKSRLVRSSPLEESSFDLNDNWLLEGNTKLPEITPEIYAAQQTRYFKAVANRLRFDVAKAAETADLSSPSTAWRFGGTLTTAETYFEFRADDPHQVVRSFENVFKAHAVAIQRSRGEDTIGDAPALRIETAKGEIVRLYAKTDERIRFEVVHTLKDVSRRGQFPSTTFTDFDSLNGLLTRLREQSAIVVNRILESAQPRACPPSLWLSPVRFIFEVIRACGFIWPRAEGDEYAQARRLIERLTTKGCIRARKGHPLHTAIHKLKEWGLLELQGQPHQGNFIPSPKARFAVQTLSAGSRLHLYFDVPGVPPVWPMIQNLANPVPPSGSL